MDEREMLVTIATRICAAVVLVAAMILAGTWGSCNGAKPNEAACVDSVEVRGAADTRYLCPPGARLVVLPLAGDDDKISAMCYCDRGPGATPAGSATP